MNIGSFPGFAVIIFWFLILASSYLISWLFNVSWLIGLKVFFISSLSIFFMVITYRITDKDKYCYIVIFPLFYLSLTPILNDKYALELYGGQWFHFIIAFMFLIFSVKIFRNR